MIMNITEFRFYLHSTMYLLKLDTYTAVKIIKTDLHSTMYLLKLNPSNSLPLLLTYLHSTMYLLKPVCCTDTWNATLSFTFHYVSIKTPLILSILSCISYLHSTMYLLKLRWSIRETVYVAFTFHYVSIKTSRQRTLMSEYYNLHSTMYLLKRISIMNITYFISIYIPLCIY